MSNNISKCEEPEKKNYNEHEKLKYYNSGEGIKHIIFNGIIVWMRLLWRQGRVKKFRLLSGILVGLSIKWIDSVAVLIIRDAILSSRKFVCINYMSFIIDVCMNSVFRETWS